MDIVCRKQKCEYNNCNRCKLKSIEVDKESFCQQYALDKDKKVQDISDDLFTKKIIVAPYVHSLNMDISCDADCIHNRNGKCYSNGIIINSVAKQAQCISYVKI